MHLGESRQIRREKAKNEQDSTIVINNSLDCIGFGIGLESFDISSLFGISFCDAKSMYDGGKRGLLSNVIRR